LPSLLKKRFKKVTRDSKNIELVASFAK
jgi:hypothetical protein